MIGFIQNGVYVTANTMKNERANIIAIFIVSNQDGFLENPLG